MNDFISRQTPEWDRAWIIDFIDRRATMWNRAWVILVGLWLLLLGRALPGVVGGLIIGLAVLSIATAAGLVELAMAIRDRRIQPALVPPPGIDVDPGGQEPEQQPNPDQDPEATPELDDPSHRRRPVG